MTHDRKMRRERKCSCKAKLFFAFALKRRRLKNGTRWHKREGYFLLRPLFPLFFGIKIESLGSLDCESATSHLTFAPMMSLYSDTDWDRLGVATATWFSLPRDQTGWPEGTDPLLDLTAVVDVREVGSLSDELADPSPHHRPSPSLHRHAQRAPRIRTKSRGQIHRQRAQCSRRAAARRVHAANAARQRTRHGSRETRSEDGIHQHPGARRAPARTLQRYPGVPCSRVPRRTACGACWSGSSKTARRRC